MEKYCFIYLIRNIVNNKVYIGKTEKTIKDRWLKHLACARRRVNRYLYDAMNKYGYNNFLIECLEEVDKNKINEREKYWIKFYKSQNKQFGYNMQEGGLGGRQPQEVIDRVRLKKKNYKVTEETKLKISLSKKGKPNHKQSEKTKKKLSEIVKKLWKNGILNSDNNHMRGKVGELHHNYKKINNDELFLKIQELKTTKALASYFKMSIPTIIERSKEYLGVVPSVYKKNMKKILLSPGTDITSILSIIKFENSIPACLSGIAKGQFPYFIPKTDETRCQILQPLLDKYIGFGCYISEKVDGSSCTFYYKDGEFGVCSRNLDLIENETNSLWKKAKEYEINEKLEYIYKMGFDYEDASASIDNKSLIKGNYALQGEIIGEGIQGNPLKLKGQYIYFYNAFNIDVKKYLDYNDFIKMMEFLNLLYVPIIKSDYVLSNNMQSIVEMSVIKSKLNPDIWAEGIVIRPVLEVIDKSFDKLEQGRVSFKCVNPQYLLKHEQ